MKPCFLSLALMAHLSSFGQAVIESETAIHRELRGVWIATVANIDWPSSGGLSTAEQKRSYTMILDHHRSLGINAVMVQIRPAGDAFYESSFEPWSSGLTGERGKSPWPYYDPLQFMIDEAHERGMEFHAWINPYRAFVNYSDSLTIPANHLIKTKREWFVHYGKNLYFNPGIPSVRKHVVDVVGDITSHYNIDAIHLDDYFYPYKIDGETFDDQKTFNEFNEGFVSVDDWRRNNINLLIRELADTIKKIKPHVQFGISPFSVWRNKTKDPTGSATNAGQTCYDDLYADILLWLREGLIDYVAPQLYFNLGHDRVDYATTLDWWLANRNGKMLFVGQGAYRINAQGVPAWQNPSEMMNQLRLNQQYNEVSGSIFFSSKSLISNPLGFADSLRAYYARRIVLQPQVVFTTEPLTLPEIIPSVNADQVIELTWKHLSDVNTNSATPYVVLRAPYSKKKLVFQTIGVVGANQKACHSILYRFADTNMRRNQKYVYCVLPVDQFKRAGKPTAGVIVKMKRYGWRSSIIRLAGGKSRTTSELQL